MGKKRSVFFKESSDLLFISKPTIKKWVLTCYEIINGVPDWNRTNDLSLRRRSLYPTELRGQKLLLLYHKK